MTEISIKHCWAGHPVNIGHFFHDILFHTIGEYIINDQIIWVLDDNLSEWEKNFTMIMINYLKIDYKIVKNTTNPRPRNNRNIKIHKHYTSIMKLIREAISNKFIHVVKPTPSYKILYFRNDASRRKMINYNNELDKYFDEIIVDMSCKTFEEQAALFIKASHMVTIEGAHLTNILFMDSNSKILVFSPMKNSWQKMFGTADLINQFKIVTTGGNFNDNIKYNKNIKKEILSFINS